MDETHNRTRRRLLNGALLLIACAAVGATVVPGWGASSVVKFTKAPPAYTQDSEAIFRFRVPPASTVWCKRDTMQYRRCATHVKFTGLRPGKHTFSVRVRTAGRTTSVRRSWHVQKSAGNTIASQPSEGRVAMSAAAKARRKLIVAEEFSGTTIDPARWYLYTGAGHNGNGEREPSAVSLNGRGQLVITAQAIDGTTVSGGMAHTREFKYGRIEARVRTEADPSGTMSGVVLTWPQVQNDPEFTENDLYETGPNRNNRREVESFVHFGAPELKWQKWKTHHIDPTKWHKFALEWYPNHMELFIDDELVWSITDRAVIPDVLHHVCLQLDARNRRPIPKQVRMFVDYVRVYR